jgi:hypothetical protein
MTLDMLTWVDDDDYGDGDDDDDDDDDAPEPGQDRLTGPKRTQSNRGNGRKDDIIATKKSKKPKKYTLAMFDEYKRGIERCWGVAANKDLVPDGIEITDNSQRRLRRELQSYGTPKGSVLELLHELAQVTQNRQEAAWVRITEEFRKRLGRGRARIKCFRIRIFDSLSSISRTRARRGMGRVGRRLFRKMNQALASPNLRTFMATLKKPARDCLPTDASNTHSHIMATTTQQDPVREPHLYRIEVVNRVPGPNPTYDSPHAPDAAYQIPPKSSISATHSTYTALLNCSFC